MGMNINELLKTKYPVIQGGMARIATGGFAADVSNAGALGVIASGGLEREMLREQIKIARSRTDKPFAVNIMLMAPNVDELAKVVIEEEIPVVTTGAGNPSKYIEAWKKAGIVVIPVVASSALARRVERYGADAVVAEGCEAGGHIGEMTTMTLMPEVMSEVKIPVIAAGGVATGRQLLAAEALGASGVQVGTMLLASEECPIHENYKNAVIKAKSSDVIVTGRSTGAPVRVMRNQMTREYLKLESEGATLEELEKLTLGGLYRAVVLGDIKTGSLMAGQVADMVNSIRPLSEILESLFKEYEEAKANLVK